MDEGRGETVSELLKVGKGWGGGGGGDTPLSTRIPFRE